MQWLVLKWGGFRDNNYISAPIPIIDQYLNAASLGIYNVINMSKLINIDKQKKNNSSLLEGHRGLVGLFVNKFIRCQGSRVRTPVGLLNFLNSLVYDSRQLIGTSGTTGIDSPDSRCTCTLKRRHTLEEEDWQAFVSGKRTWSKKQDQLKTTSLNVTPKQLFIRRDGEKDIKQQDHTPYSKEEEKKIFWPNQYDQLQWRMGTNLNL